MQFCGSEFVSTQVSPQQTTPPSDPAQSLFEVQDLDVPVEPVVPAVPMELRDPVEPLAVARPEDWVEELTWPVVDVLWAEEPDPFPVDPALLLEEAVPVDPRLVEDMPEEVDEAVAAVELRVVEALPEADEAVTAEPELPLEVVAEVAAELLLDALLEDEAAAEVAAELLLDALLEAEAVAAAGPLLDDEVAAAVLALARLEELLFEVEPEEAGPEGDDLDEDDPDETVAAVSPEDPRLEVPEAEPAHPLAMAPTTSPAQIETIVRMRRSLTETSRCANGRFRIPREPSPRSLSGVQLLAAQVRADHRLHRGLVAGDLAAETLQRVRAPALLEGAHHPGGHVPLGIAVKLCGDMGGPVGVGVEDERARVHQGPDVRGAGSPGVLHRLHGDRQPLEGGVEGHMDVDDDLAVGERHGGAEVRVHDVFGLAHRVQDAGFLDAIEPAVLVLNVGEDAGDVFDRRRHIALAPEPHECVGWR